MQGRGAVVHYNSKRLAMGQSYQVRIPLETVYTAKHWGTDRLSSRRAETEDPQVRIFIRRDQARAHKLEQPTQVPKSIGVAPQIGQPFSHSPYTLQPERVAGLRFWMGTE